MKTKYRDIRLDKANLKEKKNHMNFPTTGMNGNGLCTDHCTKKLVIRGDANSRNGKVVIVGQSQVERTLLEKAIAFKKEAKQRARAAAKAARDVARKNKEFYTRQAEVLPQGGGLNPVTWEDRTKL